MDVFKRVQRHITTEHLEQPPLRFKGMYRAVWADDFRKGYRVRSNIRPYVNNGITSSQHLGKQFDFCFAPFSINIQTTADKGVIYVKYEKAVSAQLYPNMFVLYEIIGKHVTLSPVWAKER